jgi:hypothetical protein
VVDFLFAVLGVVLLIALPVVLRRLLKEEQATDRSRYNPNYPGGADSGSGSGLP